MSVLVSEHVSWRGDLDEGAFWPKRWEKQGVGMEQRFSHQAADSERRSRFSFRADGGSLPCSMPSTASATLTAAAFVTLARRGRGLPLRSNPLPRRWRSELPACGAKRPRRRPATAYFGHSLPRSQASRVSVERAAGARRRLRRKRARSRRSGGGRRRSRRCRPLSRRCA